VDPISDQCVLRVVYDGEFTHLIVATTISGLSKAGKGCRRSASGGCEEPSFFIVERILLNMMMVTYDDDCNEQMRSRKSGIEGRSLGGVCRTHSLLSQVLSVSVDSAVLGIRCAAFGVR
jgi:hypothetical protein